MNAQQAIQVGMVIESVKHGKGQVIQKHTSHWVVQWQDGEYGHYTSYRLSKLLAYKAKVIRMDRRAYCVIHVDFKNRCRLQTERYSHS